LPYRRLRRRYRSSDDRRRPQDAGTSGLPAQGWHDDGEVAMKGRLRIMARVHAMPPDHNAGAEHMLVAMLQALVERGHDVEVWLSRRGTATEVYEYGGVRVIPSAARLDFPSQVRHA